MLITEKTKQWSPSCSQAEMFLKCPAVQRGVASAAQPRTGTGHQVWA